LKSLFLFFSLFFSLLLHGQRAVLEGRIVDDSGQPVPAVNIILKSDRTIGTVSNANGYFKLDLEQGSHDLILSHVQYGTHEFNDVATGASELFIVTLKKNIRQLEDVIVAGSPPRDAIDPAVKIAAESAQNLPSAFGDFNKVLLTLPGVSGNNELSSTYNVRGGNFDENLIYVNDIPVYRPFLANAGRQEGLSFINPSLVNDIRFYAGGWEAKYGDKLSSTLNIDYKEPEGPEGNMTIGLLGGSAYIGNRINDDIQYLFGARHRDSRYLLGTLETRGEYLPVYTDVQGFLTFDLSKGVQNINRTKLNWLFSYGRNRYLTLPVSQSTEFGTVSQVLRIQTAFNGREELDYDTYQSGINLSHRWSDSFLSRWIVSGVYTGERENYTVEGAYRICDIDNAPSSTSFNDCIVVRGQGTDYSYGRNKLEANLLSAEWRNEILLSDWSVLETGAGYARNIIDDRLNEYAFLDSAGFVTLNQSTFNALNLAINQFTGYLQTTVFSKDSMHALNAGIRANYLDYNNQLLFSPRFIYRFKPRWDKETSFRISVGQYSQPPFYRELRDPEGNIREEVQAQRSLHFIGAMEHVFNMWNRPFLFTVEGYYKRLSDVIPYDIDNVRLRYFANNDAEAFARGLDLRINGEFIRGTQSWFSLGFLRTKEDIVEDDKRYIRRPTDQNINLAFYFEDHLPNDPSMRVYVNSVIGSGFPSGPPNNFNARNIFSGDEYYRVDIGLSKSFELTNHKYLKTFWLRLEVLNVLAADNTLSYSWIQDVNGAQLAIPNSLSARFLNLKISINL